MPIIVPRRYAFAGSINSEEGDYLSDPTGARRFWPIATQTIDLEGISRDRDLIWVETVLRFQASAPIRLDTSVQINRLLDVLHDFTH